MLYDILEDSPAFKEIKNKGQLEALQQTLVNITQARFPQMGRLTKRLAGIIDDTEVLQDLIVKMSLTQTKEEAKQLLLDVLEDEDDE